MLFNQEFISPYLVFQGLLNFPQQLQERTTVFQFHPSKWKLFDTGQLSIQFQILKRKKKTHRDAQKRSDKMQKRLITISHQ